MVKQFAKIAGFILVLIGLAGFIEPLTPNHQLLGVFAVDLPHNLVHLVSGAILLAVGVSNNCALMRRVVLGFAVIYGLIGILGFFTPVMFGMRVNLADNLLHLVIATTAAVSALPRHHIAQR